VFQLSSSITYYRNIISSSSQIRLLSAGVALLRALNANRDSVYVDSLLTRHPELRSCLHPNTNSPCYNLISIFLNHLLLSPDKTPTSASLTPTPTQHPSQVNNIISNIKVQLPTDRKRLTHIIPYSINDPLRDDEDPLHHHTLPITDPVEMAQNVALYWGKIWEARLTPPPPGAIRDYLNAYLQRVPPSSLPSFPNRTHQKICEDIDMSWKEAVERAISSSNDSAPGPDGIPFAAYRALPEICGPFLLYILFAGANGAPPPPGLTTAGFFSFPKTTLTRFSLPAQLS
jgi:hypothetical protein